MKRSIYKVLGLVVAITLHGSSFASADQTVNIDLNNFQSDGLGQNYPNYTIQGVDDGDVITINVSNAAQGFLGYINDGAGNGINLANGAAININNNTGQFYGAGILSSVSYDNAIIGNYTITVTIGANGLLSQNVNTEKAVADFTSNPLSAMGWLVLEWRLNLVNVANWKQISLVREGVAAASIPVSNSLKVLSKPTLTQTGQKLECSPGTYLYLNGGSTEESSNIGAFVYTLVIDGKPVSRVGGGDVNSIPVSLFNSISQSITGSANLNGASWDVSGLKNFDAYCQVFAWQNGANMQSASDQIADDAKRAEIAAKAQAWEDQRSTATAANFTKEARKARKRAAARTVNP